MSKWRNSKYGSEHPDPEQPERAIVWVFVALIALMLVLVSAATALAENNHLDQFGPVDTVEMIFYPFLPQGELIDGLVPSYGSITVQNLEDADVRIWAFTDAEFEPEGALGTYVLPPNGSITLSASALGLESPGSPVVVAGVFRSIWEADSALVEDEINTKCPGPSHAPSNEGWIDTCKPSIAGIAKLSTPEPLVGLTGNQTSAAHISVDGYNAISAQDVAWGSQSEFCDAIVANWPDDCSGIGTYEPFGYGVGFVFDGHSYLPVVQTNSGWNTEIRISNIDPSVWAGQVNVTLIASNQQGHASSEEHKITFEETLRPGESWALDLRANGVPEGWVGSAHITSNVGVVAYAARFKASDVMLMINVAAPSSWATTSPGTEFQSTDGNADLVHFHGYRYEMHAPLVFREYHGWNTGISIANIDEMTNQVTVTWFDGEGSIRGVDVRTVPPQGQTYVYLPSTGDVSPGGRNGWVGSVTLSAGAPFHATVDQIKYETGEAMSYMATAAGARVAAEDDSLEPVSTTLALPLMQKGRADSFGDTSGIQLFNPDPSGAVDIEVRFYSQIGDLLSPTTSEPVRATVPARGYYTIYAADLTEMISNTTGTARVDVVGGTGQVFGVSNSVNYAVAGDGSVAFNLVNSFGQYRFPTSQTVLP
jgi:hypothetical protein